MATKVEISIPNTETSATSKPYTIYNITLRLSLRSFTLQKRYSDFTTLHSSLAAQAGAAVPATLPSKSWFTKTTSSPELTEERRKGLEEYLNTINQSHDDRWRNTSAWRAFLNLPSNISLRSNTTSNLQSTLNGPAGAQPIRDPVVWLDHHRDLKSQLHDARLALIRRDQASTAQGQHEASAQAKKSLVRAGTMVATLESSLQSLSSARGGSSLGEGELRRRRDLISSARREREGLENLLSAIVAKAALDVAVANADEKTSLLGNDKPKPRGGRVLGKESDRTRALDNEGVLQLQKQLMQDQDEGVSVLGKAVARQKELSIQIQEELEVQHDMLNLLDEDASRLQGKMDVARNRVGKLS